MVEFIRKLYMSTAGHFGLAIPVEAVSHIAKPGTVGGFEVLIRCEDGKLIIEPLPEVA